MSVARSTYGTPVNVLVMRMPLRRCLSLIYTAVNRSRYLAVTGRERINELRQMLGFELLGSLETRTAGSFKPGAF